MRKLLFLILRNSTVMPFRRCGNIYQCFYCYETFHKASDLKQHISEHADLSQIYRTVNRCGLKCSIKIDITELRCTQCDEEFDDLKIFLTHLKEDHKENNYIEALKHIDCYKLTDSELKCLVCDESFQFFNTLLIHTLRTHKLRQLICEICGLTFATKNSINKHYQSAHETSPNNYKCRHCDKTYLTSHRRADHEKRIHSIKARRCPICGLVSGSSFKKVSHMIAVHNHVTTEFKCENCPKTFRLQNELVKHNRRVHLKEKTKICEVCGDKFFDNHLLSLHMVRHSGTKPFECEICNKKFPRKRGLDIHVRIHTNDKRCVCKVCGKAFVQTASLKLHMRVHHSVGKKPKGNKWNKSNNDSEGVDGKGSTKPSD